VASETESGPRARRREERRALGRDQILDAAEQIFAEHGFHEASLREIAERAEFSVGGIYTFFATKDELYRECMHRRGSQFMTGMRAVAEAGGSPLRRLHDLADWQVGFFRQHPHFARLVIRGGAVAPPLSEPEQDVEIRDNFRAAQALQADLVVAGQNAGEIRAGSPTVLARLFSGLVSAYQTTELEGDDEPAGTPVSLLHDVLDGALARTGTGTLQ
jgi:TetR/AcrR family transcriptional regulator